MWKTLKREINLLTWKCTVASSLPFGLCIYRRGTDALKISLRLQGIILSIGLCSFIFGATFLYALQHTTITRAYTLGNTYALIERVRRGRVSVQKAIMIMNESSRATSEHAILLSYVIWLASTQNLPREKRFF